MTSSPIDEIKNRLDIVEVVRSYIKLEKAGINFRAVCPFHSEKKPSFFVSPSRQIWHCFGCQKGGDIFAFIKEIEGVEFGDALRILAQKAGIELKRQDPKIRTERQRLSEISEFACSFFEKQLQASSVGKEAKGYLLKRGVTEQSIKNWHLGYAPDIWRGLSDFLVGKGYKREEIARAGLSLKSEKGRNYYDRFRGRIIFPVFNLSSQIVGFGARIFKQTKRPDGQDEAKYINSPATLLYDKSKVLYGLNKSAMKIRKENACVLVEGYTDVILAHQAGYENVVATSGTALTNFQLNILKRYSENLFTAFDMDVAGNTATKRGIDLAQAQGFNIRIITMPEDSDPADVIAKNPKSWAKLVEKAKSIHDFYFETTLKKFDKNTLEGKKQISKILLPVIKRIPNKIEQTLWIRDLAKTIGVKEEDVLEELKKVKISQDDFGRTYEAKEPELEIKLSPKTRKELLAERFAVLAIMKPKNLDLITEDDLKIFPVPFCQVINCFRKEGTSVEKIPPALNELANYLFLKAEVKEFEEEPEINPEQECRECLKAIKTLSIKDKLEEISKEIRKAEDDKNSPKVQELLKEFNHFSKSWSDLETA